jgi:uncharacterized protein (TIGR03435 family)
MLCGAVAWPFAQAQSAGFTPRKDADRIPSYDLVSIHKTPDATTARGMDNQPNGLSARGETLRSLIGEAYGFSLGLMSEQQLVGTPDWGKTQRFDIRAKVDSEDVPRVAELEKAETMLVQARQMVSRTPGYRMVMLQRLLEDRFKLKVHYEQKVMSLFEMTIAKGGVRMKVAHPTDPEDGSMSWSGGKMSGQNVPMSFIPAIFALVLERPVEDKTGTEGNFDFEMHWARLGDEGDNATGDVGPSLFTAVQEQMGLKLRASKGPVWVIVVDHAEPPSEN